MHGVGRTSQNGKAPSASDLTSENSKVCFSSCAQKPCNSYCVCQVWNPKFKAPSQRILLSLRPHWGSSFSKPRGSTFLIWEFQGLPLKSKEIGGDLAMWIKEVVGKSSRFQQNSPTSAETRRSLVWWRMTCDEGEEKEMAQLPPAWPWLNRSLIPQCCPWQPNENGEKQKTHLAQN